MHTAVYLFAYEHAWVFTRTHTQFCDWLHQLMLNLPIISAVVYSLAKC